MSHALLSVKLREGLINYNLLPTEALLVHLMCLDTLDRGLTVGRVNLSDWARRLGMMDGKGLRVDKCERVLKSVVDLLIVDLNAAQGTYELRPHAEDWSRLRAVRCAARLKTEGELPLSDERPLSEALSDHSRQQALKAEVQPPQCAEQSSLVALSNDDPSEAPLGGGPGPDRDWPALFQEMGRAVVAGGEVLESFKAAHPEFFSAEKSADSTKSANLADGKAHNLSAEKSADSRRNSPTQQTPVNIEVSAPSEKSAKFADVRGVRGEAIASSASVPTKAKLAIAIAGYPRVLGELSAEKSAEAKAWLQSVDLPGQLYDKFYAEQWFELCDTDPIYVLTRLKSRFEKFNAKEPVADPLAWMSYKARDDRKLRPLPRR